MKRFMYNAEYVKNEYLKGKSQTEKKAELSSLLQLGTNNLESKINGRRSFSIEDYEICKDNGIYLLLDTEKLLYKFFDRVNLDLTPNEKFIVFIFLCEYDKKNKWVTIDELKDSYSFIEKKVIDILENSKIKTSITDEKEKIFLNKCVHGTTKYSLNITALIKYTEL